MTNRKLIIPFLAACAVAFAQGTNQEFFEQRIRPVLTEKCFPCHTAAGRQGGLRLDTRQGLMAGGNSGPAIVIEKPDESLLIRALTHADPKLQMPKGAAKLLDSVIADFASWVKAGAPWPDEPPPAPRRLWSLQPLTNPAVPAVKDAAWARTPIDRFILAKLEENTLRPVRAADKRTLIRRVTFDLTGLPPTPTDIEAFLADQSPEAFAKVVDRLLASPHYGEQWGRHWLDVARYADGDGIDHRPVYIGYGMDKDGYANTFRYRDWVIDAFNRDLPYDTFVKAQIAADLMPEKQREPLMPALGFFGLGPWFTGDDVVFAEARASERDDKVDTVTKAFLGLTVACARCHDHKYDPISQTDYYALAGVFASSGYTEHNLASQAEVHHYQSQLAKVKAQETATVAFMDQARLSVARMLAGQTAQFMLAVRRQQLGKPPADTGLDAETLERWDAYLSQSRKIEHPFLKPWFHLMAQGGGSDKEAERIANEFQALVLSVYAEKVALMAANEERRRNYTPDAKEDRVRLPGGLMQFELFQFKQSIVEKPMNPQRFYVWLDVIQGEQASQDYAKKDGIYEFDYKKLPRFFTMEQKVALNGLLASYKALQKDLPAEYPYLMTISDNATPVDLNLNLRGNPHALGDVIPRGLPGVLAGTPIAHGSGRLELAEAIVRHPLAARVIVNRVWMHHFGQGIVASPSNFGAMGDRPSHPELLDYLAGRLIANGWSIKALHREILLSATYALSVQADDANEAVDPDNRYLWRANLRRLEAESVRDSLLFVSGALDETLGGPPQELTNPANNRRTVYSRIRRSVFVCTSGTGGLDPMLQLFDFPDPTVSVDRRSHTTVPLQGLFFLNSGLVMSQAERVAKLATSAVMDDAARIQTAYALLFGMPAKDAEVQLGLEFLRGAGASAWPQYAQVLLSSSEFYHLQ